MALQSLLLANKHPFYLPSARGPNGLVDMMSTNNRVINTESSTTSRVRAHFLSLSGSLRVRTVRVLRLASVHGRDPEGGVTSIPSLISTRSLFSTHISAITPISTGAYKPVSTVFYQKWYTFLPTLAQAISYQFWQCMAYQFGFYGVLPILASFLP